MNRNPARYLVALSILLYCVALAIPACNTAFSINDNPEIVFAPPGWCCLVFGVLVPYLWGANPLLWAAWLRCGKKYGVHLGSAALVAGIFCLFFGLAVGDPEPLAGEWLWLLSIALGFVATVLSQSNTTHELDPTPGK